MSGTWQGEEPPGARAAALGGDGGVSGSGEISWRIRAGVAELVVELRPWFLPRTPGLPARLLDGMGHPDLRRLTERLLDARRRLAAERERFLRQAAPLRDAVLRLPPERCALAGQCLRSVRAGAPLTGDEIRLLESLGMGERARRWQSAVVAAGSARAAARSAHAAAWLVTRRRVAEAYDDESVRHAALLADPAFHREIERHPLARRPGDGTARRSRLRTAAAHRLLRRLAVEGGGPRLRARFEPGGGGSSRVREPGSEPVVIGGAALERLREALTAVVPLWCLAALLAREGGARRELGAVLAGMASEALRSGEGQEVVRLDARAVALATAGWWAEVGEWPDPVPPGPELVAAGAEPGAATWLLSGTGPGRGPLYEGPGTAPVEVDLGARTPRIMIGDLVYQRARWRLHLPEERGADPFDRWLAIHRLRRERGLPRHVFVRHPAEPGPFPVDFCDPLAVEDLARHEPAEVLVTEMSPVPGQERGDGQAWCAELRVACLVRRER
ncbi:hypothetical protein ACBJ59_32835 [Nonomuraea sp. MTCD27]|uniref:hypothetical protein n=1 Tax=Nonomuraea sp. MTCD27 TaxID=1676747 RepID=UPI0035BF5AEB